MKVSKVEVPQQRQFTLELSETELRVIVAACYHCTVTGEPVDQRLREIAAEHDVRGWSKPEDAKALGVIV